MNPVTLLLVDDHSFFLRTLRRFLEEQPDHAFEVVAEAADGVEACEISQQLGPQVIIMDVQMPRRDGVEACRQIRRDRPEAQVILYTMHDPGPYRDPAVVPAAACIAKQDLFEQLLPTLSRLATNSFDPQVERNSFRSEEQRNSFRSQEEDEHPQ